MDTFAIDRADGVRHELSPKGNQPGTYVDEKGRPAYRNRGLGSRGQIYRLADQSIYVYWDTAGLPGTTPTEEGGAPVSATAGTAPKTARAPLAPFDKTLTLQGISFRVKTPNDASINMLEIIPSGLEIDNRPMSREIDGTVTGAEVADLNRDGSPELYVYVTSAGSGSYGSLVAYSSNKRKSLSEIYLPRSRRTRNSRRATWATTSLPWSRTGLCSASRSTGMATFRRSLPVARGSCSTSWCPARPA
jgi:hypothetical protein